MAIQLNDLLYDEGKLGSIPDDVIDLPQVAKPIGESHQTSAFYRVCAG